MQLDTVCAALGVTAVVAFLIPKPKPVIVYNPGAGPCSARAAVVSDDSGTTTEPVESEDITDNAFVEGFHSVLTEGECPIVAPKLNLTAKQMSDRKNSVETTFEPNKFTKRLGINVQRIGCAPANKPPRLLNPASASCFNLPAFM